MENMIDNLIAKDEYNLAVARDTSEAYSVDVVNCGLNKHTTVKQTNDHHCNIPNGIAGHLAHTSAKNAVSRDANNITKVVGFLNHHPTEFNFVGPDREPQVIDNIEKCLEIAKIIEATGAPNYQKARVPIKSELIS